MYLREVLKSYALRGPQAGTHVQQVTTRMNRQARSVILLALFLLAVCAAGQNRATDQPVVQGMNANRYVILDEHRFTAYLKPSIVVEHQGIRYQTNSYGLRGVDFPLEKAADTLRVVCLGDSLTYGYGNPYEDTYGQQLERKLSAAGRKAQVINAGINGHIAWQGLERLSEHVLRFKPDIVTVLFGLNDANPRPETFWEVWRERLVAQKGLAAKDEPTRSAKALRTPLPEQDFTRNIPIEEYGLHLKQIIARLKSETSARVYLVTFHQVSADFRHNEPAEVRDGARNNFEAYHSRMLSVGKAMGVEVVDVWPKFNAAPGRLLLGDGVHPTPAGLAIYADEIAKAILSELK